MDIKPEGGGEAFMARPLTKELFLRLPLYSIYIYIFHSDINLSLVCDFSRERFLKKNGEISRRTKIRYTGLSDSRRAPKK